MRKWIFTVGLGAFLCGIQNVGAQDNSVAIEALSRLKGMDLEANPALKAAVLKVVNGTKGTAQFVELVKDFSLKGQGQPLLEYAQEHPTESAAAEALRIISAEGQTNLVVAALSGPKAAAVATAAGNSGEKALALLLEPVVLDGAHEVGVRKAALTGLAQTLEGAQFLVALAKEDKFPTDLRFTAMTELNNLRWANLKAEGAKLMPLPSTQNAQPLPPIAELVKLKGDATKGAQVFRRVEVGCINCHQVNREGMDFGPRLSEIGAKLGKDAIYESILDPSAGISFGFEAWQLELKNGDEPFGIIASETADEVAVKTQNGITSKYKKDEIVKRDKMKTSIMPTGLQLTMSQADLVDLVEYLTTLKKAAH